jgi:hypothetical protein
MKKISVENETKEMEEMYGMMSEVSRLLLILLAGRNMSKKDQIACLRLSIELLKKINYKKFLSR